MHLADQFLSHVGATAISNAIIAFLREQGNEVSIEKAIEITAAIALYDEPQLSFDDGLISAISYTNNRSYTGGRHFVVYLRSAGRRASFDAALSDRLMELVLPAFRVALQPGLDQLRKELSNRLSIMQVDDAVFDQVAEAWIYGDGITIEMDGGYMIATTNSSYATIIQWHGFVHPQLQVEAAHADRAIKDALRRGRAL